MDGAAAQTAWTKAADGLIRPSAQALEWQTALHWQAAIRYAQRRSMARPQSAGNCPSCFALLLNMSALLLAAVWQDMVDYPEQFGKG